MQPDEGMRFWAVNLTPRVRPTAKDFQPMAIDFAGGQDIPPDQFQFPHDSAWL
jgi:hypothetical protein